MSEQPLLPLEYLWIIYAGFIAVFIMVLLAVTIRNRGKLLVRVKYPLTEKEVWMKPSYHGQQQVIVMQKPSKKDPGWHFTFTNECLIPKKSWAGLKSFFALDVFPDAPKACRWDYSVPVVDQPKLTKKDVQDFNNMRALHARYKQIEGAKTSGAVWIIALLCAATLIVGIVNFLATRGMRI